MTITIDLPPETLEQLRADAETRGEDLAEVVRGLVESAYPPSRIWRTLPPPGFAAHMRREGRDGAVLVREMRTEWDERP